MAERDESDAEQPGRRFPEAPRPGAAKHSMPTPPAKAAPTGMPPPRREHPSPPEPSSAPSGDARDGKRDGGERRRWIIQGVAALVVLLLATALLWYLYTQKTKPAKIDGAGPADAVEVLEVYPSSQPVVVTGYAAVQAREQLALAPRVSGRVEWVHPDLLRGGFVSAGRTLVRIDATDFQARVSELEAAVQQAEARLSQLKSSSQAAKAELAGARRRLERVEAEAAVAVEQFHKLYPEQEPPPLVARIPQLDEATAQVRAAEEHVDAIAFQRAELTAAVDQRRAQLDQAQVELDRTMLAAPMGDDIKTRYRVRSEDVSVGDQVSPGQVIARLYRVDAMEVAVPLQARELRWINMGSDAEEAEGGSPATLHADESGEVRTWPGRVERAEGEVDPQSRLLDVIVAVTDVGDPSNPRSLLVPGRFVRVEIEGRRVEDVYALPREALRGAGEDRVWLAQAQKTSGAGNEGDDDDEDETKMVLADRKVELVHAGDEQMLVRGLEPGDAVVLTRLDAPAEGSRLEITERRSLSSAEADHLRRDYERLRGKTERARQRMERAMAGKEGDSGGE